MADTSTKSRESSKDSERTSSRDTSSQDSGTDVGSSAYVAPDPERSTPDVLTSKDALGTERIITVVSDPWEPAPTEATGEQQAAAEKRIELEESRTERRLKRLLGEDADGGDVSQEGVSATNDTSSANAGTTSGGAGEASAKARASTTEQAGGGSDSSESSRGGRHGR